MGDDWFVDYLYFLNTFVIWVVFLFFAKVAYSWELEIKVFYHSAVITIAIATVEVDSPSTSTVIQGSVLSVIAVVIGIDIDIAVVVGIGLGIIALLYGQGFITLHRLLKSLD